METAPIQRRSSAPDVPLERLAANPAVPKAEKLDAACRAFEAVLLRQVLDSATRPLIASGLEGDSSIKAIYRDLVTDQMSSSIARSGQLGLARSFVEQLGERRATGQPKAVGNGAKAGTTPDPASGLGPLIESRPEPLRGRPGLQPFRKVRYAVPQVAADPASGLEPLLSPARSPLQSQTVPKAPRHE